MGIWSIIVGIGTLASIAAWLHVLFKDKSEYKNIPKTKILIYPLLAILFAGLTGYFAYQNAELKSMEKEAKEISSTFPYVLNYNYDDIGKYTAIILRGIDFFEGYKKTKPVTYQYAKSIIDSAKIDEHVSSKEDFDLKQMRSIDYTNLHKQ